jgi:hypothetical protein
LSFSVPLDSHSYSINGKAVAFEKTTIIPLFVGEYSLSGKDASVRHLYQTFGAIPRHAKRDVAVASRREAVFVVERARIKG